MKFKIKQNVLNDLLRKSKDLVKSKDVDPVLTNFLLTCFKDRVSVLAADMELSLLAATSLVEIEIEGRALFPAKVLFEVVKTLEADSLINIEVKEGVGKLFSEKSSWNMILMEDIEKYPSVLEVACVLHECESALFISALRKTLTAVSFDNKRPETELIKICKESVEATDEIKYQRVTVDFKGEDVLLTASEARILESLLSSSAIDRFELGASEDMLVVKIGEDLFIGQRPTASFIDCSSLVSRIGSSKKILSVKKKDILGAIKKVRILADADTRLLSLLLKKDLVVLSCRDKYGNSANIELEASWQEESLEVGFNADFLYDLIETFDSVDVDIRIGDNKGKQLCPILIEESNHIAILAQAII